MDSDHVDSVELTLDRAGEISQGRGAPPTERELAEYRKHEALIAAVLRKLAAPLQMTERKRSQFRQGMAIYRGLSPEEQKRWGTKRRSSSSCTFVQHAGQNDPRRPGALEGVPAVSSLPATGPQNLLTNLLR